jgi:tRNA pseudouridine55 synthase
VLAERTVHLDRAQLDQVLTQFQGEIDQVPPMHSALKRDGKPLYEYARQGLILERSARRVSIHELHAQWLPERQDHLVLWVRCSKGTYIRTLAEDIGNALGCGASLSALRRSRLSRPSRCKTWSP